MCVCERERQRDRDRDKYIFICRESEKVVIYNTSVRTWTNKVGRERDRERDKESGLIVTF